MDCCVSFSEQCGILLLRLTTSLYIEMQRETFMLEVQIELFKEKAKSDRHKKIFDLGML